MNVALVDGDPGVQLDLNAYPEQGRRGQVVIVQNLGAGDVYFDRDEDVDASTGVKIAVDGYYEFTVSGVFDQYFMADGGDVDLRVTVVG